jgi:hypothetical protein
MVKIFCRAAFWSTSVTVLHLVERQALKLVVDSHVENGQSPVVLNLRPSSVPRFPEAFGAKLWPEGVRQGFYPFNSKPGQLAWSLDISNLWPEVA